MLRKILEDLPGNTQKQSHFMTRVSQEYLEYSSETSAMERRCPSQCSSKCEQVCSKKYSLPYASCSKNNFFRRLVHIY